MFGGLDAVAAPPIAFLIHGKLLHFKDICCRSPPGIAYDNYHFYLREPASVKQVSTSSRHRIFASRPHTSPTLLPNSVRLLITRHSGNHHHLRYCSTMSSQQTGSFGGGSAAQASTSDFTSLEKPVTYICGDCASDVTLKKADPLRCLQCGHRILHKKRTAKLVCDYAT